MSRFIPFDRSQPYLLPPDLKLWLPADDMAHFIVAAVERVPMSAFCVPVRKGGKAQYHPRLMLALLIFSYANGLFSSRRIERATYRDIGVRFVSANLHPDHDTIATFRRINRVAIEAAFAQVLLLARETGLLRLGVVSIDGTKIDADASKYRSLRYDRIRELREQLAVDIAKLMEQAEQADTTDGDLQALPEELTRREMLKAKLDEACARLEADAKAQARAERFAYEKKKAVYDAKTGRRGRAPEPPDDNPPSERQINLTDPDSHLMRRSDAHEFRPLPQCGKARRITEPWRIAMKERLETTEARDIYRLRKQTVEPVFGIIKSVIGFRKFSLRGLAKVTTEWTPVALAYNCKRIARIQAA